MKLLMCLDCADIFSLSPSKVKQCSCDKTIGKIIGNELAEIKGNCQPIGFHNSSFIEAFKQQKKENNNGIEFIAFFIPKSAPSIKIID